MIPFCEFGGNLTGTGSKIEQFELPVCNSFEAKIQNDQLCYEVDLNKFSNNHNIDRGLDLGFSFIMDYNEDRQVTFAKNFRKKKVIGLTSSIFETDQDQEAFIYLNTIGNN